MYTLTFDGLPPCWGLPIPPPCRGVAFVETICCCYRENGFVKNNKLSWGTLLGKIMMNLIHSRTFVSEMVSTKNIVGKIYFLLILSASNSTILGLHSPLLSGIFFLFVLLLSSRLMRIVWLCGLDQIHLIGLSRDYNSLG